MADASPTIRWHVEDEGRIGVLVLDRLAKRNAIDRPTSEAFHAALRQLREEKSLRVLILTGVEKSFCAGGDFNEMLGKRSEDAFTLFLGPLFREVEDFPWPVIAAVNGFALGGGTELALACDIRLAARSALFGQPEVGIGTIPNAGGLYRLLRCVSPGRAKELVFTGRSIRADEALSIGLVEEVVDDGALLDRARELARSIAEQAPMAVRLAKAAMNSALRGEPCEGTLERTIMALLIDSDERRRRVTEFLEKRGKWARG